MYFFALIAVLCGLLLRPAISDNMFVDRVANIPADVHGVPFNSSFIQQCSGYDDPSELKPHQIHIVVPSTAGFAFDNGFPIDTVHSYAAFHGYQFHALNHMDILQTYSRKFNMRQIKGFEKNLKPIALLCKQTIRCNVLL